MKHILKVSEDGSFFTVTTEGDGDVEGIIAFLKDIISHPQWKAGKSILLDHRALRIDKITISGIDDVSLYFRSINGELGDGKIALVMKRDIDYGITRAWENITAHGVDIKIYVFRDMENTLQWFKE